MEARYFVKCPANGLPEFLRSIWAATLLEATEFPAGLNKPQSLELFMSNIANSRSMRLPLRPAARSRFARPTLQATPCSLRHRLHDLLRPPLDGKQIGRSRR